MNHSDTGFQTRMEVLQSEINNHIKPLLDGHDGLGKLNLLIKKETDF